METAPRSCRFLSLVVVERVLINLLNVFYFCPGFAGVPLYLKVLGVFRVLLGILQTEQGKDSERV